MVGEYARIQSGDGFDFGHYGRLFLHKGDAGNRERSTIKQPFKIDLRLCLFVEYNVFFDTIFARPRVYCTQEIRGEMRFEGQFTRRFTKQY